ncbi:SDR family NAD(P)-dependent oxidoreductase [Streptomyces sp. NPDC005143]
MRSLFGFEASGSSHDGRQRFVSTPISPAYAAQILAAQERSATEKEPYPIVAAAITEIRKATGKDDLRVGRLDLADKASITAFASAWTGPLHILVNNAGVMALPALERTPDGWELQFASNHLGHFALAVGLHDALAAAGNARIVSLSSRGHHASPVEFDDINFNTRAYDPWLAYGDPGG